MSCGVPMNKRLVLLDRDGVLNVDTGYVHTAAQWQWIPGAPEAIAYLSECGCRIAVVTNQSGIARGMYTEGQVQELQRFVNHQLAMTGGQIDRFYYCPHLPQAPIAKYDCVCECRKPSPGMIVRALQDFDCKPCEAVLIGDSARDLEAARRAEVDAYLFAGGNLYEFVRALRIGEGTHESDDDGTAETNINY